MKLNADVGETNNRIENSDQEIVALIDQANIACTGHCGDGITMAKTVELALKYGVQVGAHPSYPDIPNFGRKSMNIPKRQLIQLLHAQIGALQGVANSMGASVSYIKPHGALYNDMMKKQSVFNDVLAAINSYYCELSLMIQASSQNNVYLDKAAALGVKLYFEAFADRAYQPNGLLVPRNEQGAVLNLNQTVEQAARIICDKQVICIDGSRLRLDADTICVHGDSPNSLFAAQQIREMLNE